MKLLMKVFVVGVRIRRALSLLVYVESINHAIYMLLRSELDTECDAVNSFYVSRYHTSQSTACLRYCCSVVSN